MTIKLVDGSHLDHGLSEEQVKYLLETPAPNGEVCVQTIELPPELGTVDCALWGPAMGDDALCDMECYWAKRGDRKGPSRLVDARKRETSLVTIVTGPHGDESCVLFTAYGGPSAPREPFEFAEDDISEDAIKSRVFWSRHALAQEVK